ncbi:MAG: MCE family protein [Phycisphaeraceae bacterium]|nr:MCE family protein [Phycisphaeraceae bacterium]
MTERGRNIAVGITVLISLAGLGCMLMLFGYGAAMLQPGYSVRLEINAAGGLVKGSRVRINGIGVGEVRSVDLRDPPTDGVVAYLRINNGVKIPKQAVVQAQSPSLLGGSAVLVLDVGSLTAEQAMDYLPTDGTAVLSTRVAGSGVEAMMSQLEASLAEPLGQLKRVAASLETLSVQWAEVGKNINALVEPRSAEQVDAGTAPGNVATLIARADTRLKELSGVLQGLDAWLNDTELHSDFKSTLVETRKTAEQLSTSINQLTGRLVSVSDELNKTLATISGTVEKASAGQGTLGKMLADPALYDNLNDAAERLNLLINEARLLMEKWKAEGLPVQF